MAAGFIVIGLLWSGVAGQQAWSRQSQLTAKFEQCMEQAPFRHSLKQQQPEQQLQPEDLQKHFDQFNQIFWPLDYRRSGMDINSLPGRLTTKTPSGSRKIAIKH